MKRHLKVQATVLAPNYDTVKVDILAQTHKAYKFAGEHKSSYYHHSSGYSLCSSTCTAYYHTSTRKNTMQQPRRHEPRMLYMEGENARANEPIIMPISEWEEFAVVIAAYNKEFAE